MFYVICPGYKMDEMEKIPDVRRNSMLVGEFSCLTSNRVRFTEQRLNGEGVPPWKQEKERKFWESRGKVGKTMVIATEQRSLRESSLRWQPRTGRP